MREQFGWVGFQVEEEYVHQLGNCSNGAVAAQRPAAQALTDTQMKQLLRRGETGVIKGFVSPKNGKKYDAALKISKGRVVPVFG